MAADTDRRRIWLKHYTEEMMSLQLVVKIRLASHGFVDALKACTQIILSNKKKDEVANVLGIKNKKKVECYAILFSCLQ